MKKFSILIILLSLSIHLSSAAKIFTYQGIVYQVIDENAKTCKTADMAGSCTANFSAEGDVTLPTQPADGTSTYTLTEIGYKSFSQSKLTSIAIPNSVHIINDQAFEGNLLLESVDIADSVTKIGEAAFYSNLALSSVKMSNSVQTIGNMAFYNCKSLTSVALPATLESIGSMCFYCADSDGALEKVSYYATDPIKAYPSAFDQNVYDNAVLIVTPEAANKAKETTPWNLFSKVFLTTDPEFITVRQDGVLYQLQTYTGDATITSIPGDKVTKIASSIIHDGDEYAVSTDNIPKIDSDAPINDLQILEGIEMLPENFCENNLNITSISFPSSLTKIPTSSFAGCKNLSEITFNEGLEIIEDNAFLDSSLPSISIPSTVASIGSCAFTMIFNSECNIYIKGSVNSPHLTIGSKAFECNLSKTTVTCDRTDVPSIEKDSFHSPVLSWLYCPPLTGAAYAATNWVWLSHIYSDTELINGIIYEADYCKHTATVKEYQGEDITVGNFSADGHDFTLYGTLKPLGDAEIKTMIFNDGVTSIPDNFANGNISIESVTFGPTVKSIGNSAFENTKLKSISLKASSVSTVTNPVTSQNGVTPPSIGAYAFLSNETPSNLESVTSDWATPPSMPENAFSAAQYTSATLTVPDESADSYKSAEGWKLFMEDTTGVNKITVDENLDSPIEIFNIQGVRQDGGTTDNLSRGIYILRKGNQSSKIIVK